MGVSIPVLQIVGYQNSGKTTLVTKIVKRLSQSGIKVATLKHHGHGGVPKNSDEGKDSAKHRDAGAIVTGVEGEGVLQLFAMNSSGWTLHNMLSLYERLPIDLAIVEGFKKAEFPKIVLLRSREDEQLLSQLDHIVLAICWYKPDTLLHKVPTFFINDDEQYLTWIGSYLKGRFN
ncbi:molybdopterin-guanine dinucleotide biosynthesis protein B [Calidifontibacillus oryziterrae]|uniref:molybdopterin-guanine dinucleotide biosynthesis protein B n=1 Tax=Calidifontibacillus oryziterrae TaxID=1191699 RepID=UPI0002D39C71|nr:molybdopterin-guanine dinucleotide biosynthesis protein B [Calidifontibacillus oryziterrae]